MVRRTALLMQQRALLSEYAALAIATHEPKKKEKKKIKYSNSTSPPHESYIEKVMRCVAVWCSVLQCVAVWCSVLQCGAMRVMYAYIHIRS